MPERLVKGGLEKVVGAHYSETLEHYVRDVTTPKCHDGSVPASPYN
jgi:hypothetical protein